MSYNIQLNDFKIEKQQIKVISAWVDPEFQKEQERLGNVLSKKTEPVLITCLKTIKLNGKKVVISFNPNSEEEIQKFIPTINKRLNYIETNENELFNSIIEQLMELKNKTWLGKNEKPYSLINFKKKLGLIKSINFQTTEKTIISINDNKLFLSHDIEIRMHNFKIKEVTLA